MIVDGQDPHAETRKQKSQPQEQEQKPMEQRLPYENYAYSIKWMYRKFKDRVGENRLPSYEEFEKLLDEFGRSKTIS